ncbi:MAG TPA: OB-fold domain-containing protein [Acidimicrobiales bacterium]
MTAIGGASERQASTHLCRAASRNPSSDDRAVIRPFPVPTDEERAFWTGGADGVLLIYRCATCGRWFHPPGPVCPACHSLEVAPRPVSGRATVWAVTVNHQQWFASLPPPYVVAIVELAEQPGLRMLTNVVGCEPEVVRSGMVVDVAFELLADDLWLPVFRPKVSRP